MKIKEIPSKDLIYIRQATLRQGQPIEKCIYPGDDDPDNFHLGLFIEDELCGIASFYLENNNHFSTQTQYRLRGMATVDKIRGQGYGKKILNHGISTLKEKGANTLWCNARTSALDFYKKLSLKAIGPEFDIPDIGPHFVMYIDF